MSDSDGDIVGDSASPPSDNDDVLGVERMPARRGERVRAGPLRTFVLLSTVVGWHIPISPRGEGVVSWAKACGGRCARSFDTRRSGRTHAAQ